jgi:extracellular factor (EF) 3-hydroxypalmitic acid methyl ester biosynthesis protein
MTTLSGEQINSIGFKTSLGIESQGTPVRLDRHTVVFETYGSQVILRTSEVLNDFSIIALDRAVYRGRAVIANLVNVGATTVCDATLDDSWLDVDLFSFFRDTAGPQGAFAQFMKNWQGICKIVPEYKATLADFQYFLTDLRLWLDQVEIGIRASPSTDRLSMEKQVASQLSHQILDALTFYFEKLESIAGSLDQPLVPVHRAYVKRQLHPTLLSSPFLHRTFFKPLGYAGDYEMVNMITRNPLEGGSLFAKIINLWFLKQPPAEAHRNRIVYLKDKLIHESLRTRAEGRGVRILALGCGPACEIQRYLKESELSSRANVTLVDFNEETLSHARSVLTALNSTCSRDAVFQFVKKSVNQILKGEAKAINGSEENRYDLVYCAGLFDYLSDQVCRRLMNILESWTSPGGLLVATNVHISNPRRLTMEYLMEWNLIHRDRARMAGLKPERTSPENCSILSDQTGVNTYAEVRKPKNG